MDLKGGIDAVAERLVKETDGGEIKKIELERKHAEIVPGEAGSGVERGSAASAAQVSFAMHVSAHCAYARPQAAACH